MNTVCHVTLYTDGSWMKKQQAGGWATLMVTDSGIWKLIADGDQNITVNRAELTAVIRGLEALTVPCNVTVVSDSQYTVNTISKWLVSWEANGWKTVSKEPVANLDLLIQLRDLMLKHSVHAVWTKAHTNKKDVRSLGNACVDAFAQLGSRGVLNNW